MSLLSNYLIGRGELRKYPRGKDSRGVDRRFSHRTVRAKTKETILQEAISEASVSPLSPISKFRYSRFSQHLEDTRVRSSNRLSASNHPQVEY